MTEYQHSLLGVGAAPTKLEKLVPNLRNKSRYVLHYRNLQLYMRKRVDVKLVRRNEEDELRRLIASPAFAQANIFDDDLAAIQVHKSRLVLNRPVYVGMSVLDLSKHMMYDFYYNELRRQYGDGASSSTPTPTVSSSRSKRKTSTKTWPNIQSSTTP